MTSYVAPHMKIDINEGDISYDIHAERDERGALELPIWESPSTPARLSRVYGTCLISTQATQDDIDKMMEQVHLRCPVANMMIASGKERSSRHYHVRCVCRLDDD